MYLVILCHSFQMLFSNGLVSLIEFKELCYLVITTSELNSISIYLHSVIEIGSHLSVLSHSFLDVSIKFLELGSSYQFLDPFLSLLGFGPANIIPTGRGRF